MKNILLISFDIIRDGECASSYSIGSLLAYVQTHSEGQLCFDNWSVNRNDTEAIKQIYDRIESTDLNYYDKIAISTYIWSETLVQETIKKIKQAGFIGKIILGGSQVTYCQQKKLQEYYPDCHIFIKGYGEKSLLKAAQEEHDAYPVFYSDPPVTSALVSPYLKGILSVDIGQRMIRMETKRGCIYSCNFCAHKGGSTRVEYLNMERVFSELDLFKEKRVKKINIIDPIFNYGNTYVPILKHMIEIDLQAKVSLQCKFELIKDDFFLELCSKLNVILEFGIQTTDKQESKTIQRINNFDKIKVIIAKLNQLNIDFEVSLIYGLPNQTRNSFEKSIKTLREIGCKKIVAYPLMLLRGTELYDQKDTLGLKERAIGDFGIPLVVESPSFSESDWMEMDKTANQLNEQ